MPRDAQFPNCDINNADVNGDGSIDALDIEGSSICCFREVEWLLANG